MNLSARVSRLEHRHGGRNPFDALTDEELETAIDAVRKRIEAETEMDERQYAEWLSTRVIDNTLPDHLDPIVVHQFVAAIVGEVNGKTRTF